MKDINEMLQERAKVYDQMKALQDKYDDKPMEGEEKNTYGNLEKAFDEFTAKIEAAKKQAERDRLMGEKAPEGKPKDDKKVSMFARALQGDAAAMTQYKAELTLGTDATAGALTAPMEFVNTLIKGLDNQLFIRQISNVVGPLGEGQSLGFPSLTTDAADASWTTEVAAAPEETTIAFGRREFKPNRLAKLVKISKTLIRHAPNPEQTVLDRIQYRLATAQENAYMTGDGSSKPLGVFTASANGISTARDVADDNTATAVTFDGLMNAKYAVKGQYVPGASWIAHRDFCKMVAKLKDTEGQYIWQPSTQMGQPDMLLGAPIYMSEFAPNTFTTGKYVAVFGDFKTGYWICDADSLYLQVLTELYAPNGENGYIVEYFGDGAPVVGEAFARVKLA